jgi:hypothetical protein
MPNYGIGTTNTTTNGPALTDYHWVTYGPSIFPQQPQREEPRVPPIGYIGEPVILPISSYNPRKVFKGTLMSLPNQGYVYVLWEDDFYTTYTIEKKPQGYFTYFEYLLRDVSVPKPNFVELKCKLLWNNSEYVKNNPSQAY